MFPVAVAELSFSVLLPILLQHCFGCEIVTKACGKASHVDGVGLPAADMAPTLRPSLPLSISISKCTPSASPAHPSNRLCLVALQDCMRNKTRDSFCMGRRSRSRNSVQAFRALRRSGVSSGRHAFYRPTEPDEFEARDFCCCYETTKTHRSVRLRAG